MPRGFEGVPSTPEGEGELDLTTEEGVTGLMQTSQSEDEWNANCDKVKAGNENDYPSFWYKAVVQSGLLTKTKANWKK